MVKKSGEELFQAFSSLKDARWVKDWTHEQVLETLKNEGRTREFEIMQKFGKVGYNGLTGGNIYFLDTNNDKARKLNEANEYIVVTSVCKEFGHLAIDMIYMYLVDWEQVLCDGKK